MGTVAQIKELLVGADGEDLAALIERFSGDGRVGVQAAVKTAERRMRRAQRERERVARLYAYEWELVRARGGGVAVGLDEVGRGPLAGPLAVGAVVLDPSALPVDRLDDSKRLSPSVREAVAREVRAWCSACAVVYVEPHEIDGAGISASLRRAFAEAVASIEDAGVQVDVILLDGDPIGFDGREVNVVKGDAKCASIAAASVIAKTERDRLMERLDAEYPGYGFADNKGYGSASHIQAIKELGLSTVHRATFCTKFTS